MAHARTESVAAASLFADTPSQSDFFSTLQDPAPVDEEPHPHRQFSPKQQGAHPHQGDASDLFAEGSSDVDSLWTPSQSTDDVQPAAVAVPNGYEYPAQDSYGATEDPYAHQGWYDEYGQWHEYDQHQHQHYPEQASGEWAQAHTHDAYQYDQATQDTAQTYDQPYDYSNPNGGAYDPYGAQPHPTQTQTQTQTRTQAYSTAGNDPYSPHPNGASQAYPQQAPSYNPYQPATASTPQSYPSADTSSTPSGFSQAYDPYKPATTSSAQSQSQSPYAIPASQSAYGAYAPNPYSYSVPEPKPSLLSPTSSKPTQHAADVYKPTTYDAYDPPVLDRPRKTARVSSMTSPTVPYAGSVYQAQPPLAPPPPSRSPYYGQVAQVPSFSQAPPPPAPVRAHTQTPPVSTSTSASASYDPYAPTAATKYTPPRAQAAVKQPSQVQPHAQGIYGTSQDVAYQTPPPVQQYGAPVANPWRSAQDPYVGQAPYDPYGAQTAGGGYEQEEQPPYATPAQPAPPPAMTTQLSAFGDAAALASHPPPARTGMSPPALANGYSPATRSQPAAQRANTPGSVRSPDSSARPSLEGVRPDYPATTSSPARHLEQARSRIASPEMGFKTTPAKSKAPANANANGSAAPYDPYGPGRPQGVEGAAGRSASPGSFDGGAPAPSYDPYSPQAQAQGFQRRQASIEEYAPAPDQPQSFKASAAATFSPYSTGGYDASRMSLESTRSAYAPSTGDDRLGRIASRAPLISFGFGGKVVSCFPNQADATAGFDVSLVSRRPPRVSVKPLKDIMNVDTAAFPGPLYCDPGTPTVNIARTAASTVKANKAAVLKYLEERVNEVDKEVGQLPAVERPKTSGKLVLLQLLKIMVENDGKLSGSPELETAVRGALVPRLKDAQGGSGAYGYPMGSEGLLVPGQALLASQPPAPSTVYEVSPAALDTIQEYLLRGQKQMAYRHALDQRLWAHALVIASSVDKHSWKEAVDEFIRTELGLSADAEPVNGRESLRVAYSMFAGHAYASVQELLPPRPLTQTQGSSTSLGMPASPMPSATPSNPTAMPAMLTTPASVETLSTWRETAATILSNATNGDAAALTGLGDLLMANKWAAAAHVCYILSPQTSMMGGVGSPAAKLILCGSENPQAKSAFHTEADPFIFSEILEFAHSLVPHVKGQDAFAGIPHLQAYRLVRAYQLAELGDIALASRYCEAITGALRQSKPSMFYTATFQSQLQELSDRLSGTPQLDKSGSWIARKMTKPTLAGFSNWLEGSVSKFIAGEGEESAGDAARPDSKKQDSPNGTPGPFAQFTVISSANTSPSASSANLAGIAGNSPPTASLAPPNSALPRRSGSALAVRPSFPAFTPTDRSASAMDMRSEPYSAYGSYGFGTQAYSANAITTAFSHSASGSADTQPGAANGTGNWWGSDSPEDGPNHASHTTEEPGSLDGGDGGNFVSMMDSVGPVSGSRSASYSSTPRSLSVAPVEEEDEEDLGFGNSTHRKKVSQASGDSSDGKAASKPSTPTTAKPVTATTSPQDKSGTAADPKGGSSWLPWKWGKKEESIGPGPVKAKLGEESSFYYDKDLKKWVNKKAGDDTTPAAAALPPPPSRAPSRAQTTSPGASTVPSTLARGVTPPPRPQSIAAPPTTTRALPPKRSHLAESFVPDTEEGYLPPSPAPPTPTSQILDPDLVPPPLSSRSSAASKRKGKSRYVDVFQQAQSPASS